MESFLERAISGSSPVHALGAGVAPARHPDFKSPLGLPECFGLPCAGVVGRDFEILFPSRLSEKKRFA